MQWHVDASGLGQRYCALRCAAAHALRHVDHLVALSAVKLLEEVHRHAANVGAVAVDGRDDAPALLFAARNLQDDCSGMHMQWDECERIDPPLPAGWDRVSV